MTDVSKETLDRVSSIFMSANKNHSSMAIYLRTYGAGWFTFLSEAYLLGNEVNKNVLAFLLSEVPVPKCQCSTCP